MSDTLSIYLVERADGKGYRPASARDRRSERFVFEGVDGDEEKNTVTYWFRRATEEDER